MLDRNIKNYGKNRRNLRPDRTDNKKSGNLRQIHRVFIQQSDPNSGGMAQRSSAAQIVVKNRQSSSVLKNHQKNKPQKHNAVNFYINIDKLKNLRISSREKPHITHSQQKTNSLHSQNRKSMLLRYPHREKKGNLHSSYEHGSNSLSRIYQPQQQHTNLLQKSKARYKTNIDEKQESPYRSQGTVNKSYLLKRKNFKKPTQQQFKDKTFIEGYLKGKQLGRGGFSKVWQGFNFSTKIFYAIKQIDTQNKYQTHLTQIWFGNFFFESGHPKPQFASHSGIKNLLTMYDYSVVNPRAFIVYETCDGSLGNMLYDIYQEEGDVDEGEQDNRLYMIKYKKLYNELRKSSSFIETFIYQIAQALDLLSSNKIVHSDIKTENILLKRFSQNGSNGFHFKLIDYGSSFQFESLKQYKLATPQYMCPQLLNYILFQNKKQHHMEMLNYVKNYDNISGIDVWGLGSIVLQLIHGLPLWLTNPTKIMVKGTFETKRGLFAVSDRSFTKILERQLYIVENLQYFLQRNNNSGVAISPKIQKVLKGMLQPNPALRLRPKQIIKILSSHLQ